jgi:hypothetical protein
MLGLQFDPRDGESTFLRNAGASTRLHDATEFYLRLPLPSTTDTYLPFQKNFLSLSTSKEKDEKLPCPSESPIFGLFPYFQEMKVGLCDLNAVSVSVNSLKPSTFDTGYVYHGD